MTFDFTFTSTHQDLFDSYDAYRTARTGMRAWARGALISLAFLWLLATLLVLTAGPLDNGWQPVAWLLIPALILFFFLVKPQLAKRHIRSSNPPSQEVGVTFTDSGIGIRVAGVISYQRSWSEVAQIVHAPKGTLITFTDASAHWLPDRIFKDSRERAALAEFIEARRPTKDDRAA
jgi:YcxB-like protein